MKMQKNIEIYDEVINLKEIETNIEKEILYAKKWNEYEVIGDENFGDLVRTTIHPDLINFFQWAEKNEEDAEIIELEWCRPVAEWEVCRLYTLHAEAEIYYWQNYSEEYDEYIYKIDEICFDYDLEHFLEEEDYN